MNQNLIFERSHDTLIVEDSKRKCLFINPDGNPIVDFWCDSGNTERFGDVRIIQNQNGKYNIIDTYTSSLFFDEWMNKISIPKKGINYISNIFSLDHNTWFYHIAFVQRSDEKYNAVIEQSDGLVLLLDNWVDDVYLFPNIDDYDTTDDRFIFYKLGECYYLYDHEQSIKFKNYCTSKECKYLFFFKDMRDKWCATNTINKVMLVNLDDIYNKDSEYPIVEKFGKFAFIDTKKYIGLPLILENGMTWFDDVKPYNDKYDTFEVSINGEWQKLKRKDI